MIKKLFLISIAIVLLASCSNSSKETETDKTNNLKNDVNVEESVKDEQVTETTAQPDRKMDVYGKITWIEWNEITLLQVDTSKDPTFDMTPTEKKKYMQSMDEAARTALKEEINKATLWEIKLTVPVWIPMTKKEAQWPDAPNLEASLADLKAWQYISVWLNTEVVDRKVAEFVKIAFTQ